MTQILASIEIVKSMAMKFLAIKSQSLSFLGLPIFSYQVPSIPIMGKGALKIYINNTTQDSIYSSQSWKKEMVKNPITCL